MKRIFLLAILVLGIVSSTLAQEKIAVGVLPFTFAAGAVSEQDATTIEEAVTDAFVQARRFTIVDRSKMDAIRNERNLQKSEDFIDGKVVEQGISLGAKYLVAGNVISVTKSSSYRSRTLSNGTVENFLVPEAFVKVACKVIDVETGQVVNSELFSSSGGGTFLGSSLAKTVEEAFGQSLSNMRSTVDRWIGVNFPTLFSIAEIQAKDSKGYATKVLIAGGSAFGLSKAERLRVVEIVSTEVNGKVIQRKKEIGQLKIDAVEDENFSICLVKEGGLEISSRFEAKAKLQVSTIK